MTSMDSEFFGQEDDPEAAVKDYDAPDISPEEYAEHTANQVANALASTTMFGVVEVAAGIAQIHVMGRVKAEHERRFVDDVVKPILGVMEKSEACNGFVGKQFLLKEDVVKYAWVISFASNDLRQSAFDICKAFQASIPRKEVVESPLMGPGTPSGRVGAGRNQPGSKGAAPVS